MIRINHVPLPAGLSAFARRNSAGDLEVFVSQELPPDRQRAAVRVALRASRRAGWRGALLPVPLAAMLAGGRGWLARIGQALRIHPVASAAAATLAVAAAVIPVAVLPQQHGHVNAGQLPPPAAVAPAPGQSTHSAGRPSNRPHRYPAGRHSLSGTPVTSQAAPPGHGTAPAPGHSSAPTPGPSPQPSPSPGTTRPSPSPAPSPSPTHNGSTCIRLLGVTICL